MKNTSHFKTSINRKKENIREKEKEIIALNQ